MHNIDLCELVLVKCLSCMFNILLNIMHKRVYWSLESKRSNSVQAEWVPNNFPFCKLASELSSFGQVDLCFVFLFIFGKILTRTKSYALFCIECNQDSKPCRIQFTKIVFIIQSMAMKYFDHVFFCIQFFFFCIYIYI